MPNSNKNKRCPELLALGEAIRNARTVKNWTQEKLASKADLDPSYLGRVERGDNNPAFLTLTKIAKALDVTTSALLVQVERLV